MPSILAFSGSNSSTSINFKLVKHTASLLVSHHIQLLDMAHFPLPMYSTDVEKKEGFPEVLVKFKNDVVASQGLLIALNEHNGYPSAYFKNVVDWFSRLDKNFLQDKKVFLMATSPGKRGAIGSLEVVKNMLPHFGATIVATFSLPSFYDNFSDTVGITDSTMDKAHREALDTFLTKI